MPPTPSGVVRQRLITAAAGLGVAALAGLAFALSYDDLRLLALTGGAAKGYAPFYPVMIDALVVVTILSLVVARRTRWWSRGLRWLLLLVLLVGAAAASTQRALNGYGPLPDRPLSAGVAIAPWAMLLLAVWLWLSMFRQARALLATRATAAAPGPAGGLPPTRTVRVVPTHEQPPAAAAGPAPDGESAERAESFERAGDLERAGSGGSGGSRDAATEPIVPGLSPAESTGPSAPISLPTDVRLVTRTVTATETTQPDIVVPARKTSEPEEPSEPDGTVRPDTGEEEDDDVELWSTLAAEDAERWAEEASDRFGGEPGEEDDPARPKGSSPVQWTPPSSTFRSSPTPPRD